MGIQRRDPKLSVMSGKAYFRWKESLCLGESKLMTIVQPRLVTPFILKSVVGWLIHSVIILLLGNMEGNNREWDIERCFS